MAFKGLSFQTEWLELSEIEQKMKQIGAAPTSTWEDGRPLYTLPVIHDHATGRIVSDSMQVAFYLDDSYPERPTLFPHGARAPIAMFDSFFFPAVFRPGADLINHEAFKRLAPASIEYIRRKAGDEYMTRISKLSTPGNSQRETLWAAVRDGFSNVSKILSANGEDSLFFYGNTPSYADFIIVAHVLWMKASLGTESREWKDVEEWDGGRWGKLLRSVEKFQVLGE